MKMTFIQLSSFSLNWKRMKLSDEDLRDLENAIAAAPSAPPVIRGTGGLRKIRFAPRRSATGKSGATRACYAYFPGFDLVYLCAVFPKNAKANLTPAECAEYRQVLTAFARYLREQHRKGWTP